jgi:hypothetical protein
MYSLTAVNDGVILTYDFSGTTKALNLVIYSPLQLCIMKKPMRAD